MLGRIYGSTRKKLKSLSSSRSSNRNHRNRRNRREIISENRDTELTQKTESKRDSKIDSIKYNRLETKVDDIDNKLRDLNLIVMKIQQDMQILHDINKSTEIASIPQNAPILESHEIHQIPQQSEEHIEDLEDLEKPEDEGSQENPLQHLTESQIIEMLPPGWEIDNSRETGEIYYRDINTDETQFEFPVDVDVIIDRFRNGNLKNKAEIGLLEDILPDGWSLKFGDNGMDIHFFNQSNGTVIDHFPDSDSEQGGGKKKKNRKKTIKKKNKNNRKKSKKRK